MAMAPNLDYLRSQIFGRFIELALDNSDDKSTEELRQEASRQIVQETREERRAAVLAASPFSNSDADTSDGALDTIVAKVWKICENQRISKRLVRAAKRRRRKSQEGVVSPNVMALNPIEVADPTSISLSEPTAPLLHTSFAGPKLIPQSDYTNGLKCRELENLYASIEQNEQIRKHREAQSAAHRNRMKYVG
jgi:hypothetical protein